MISSTNYLGNYWDDYTSYDVDGDGIGDTPYQIGSDVDNYPLMQPFENYVTPTKPVASFTYYPETPRVNQIITFNASSSYDPDGMIVSYRWEFGDGSVGYGMTVTHAYSQPGTYMVNLTVTDNDELSSTASEIIVEYEDGEPWQKYDKNNDNKISDKELIDAIMDWLNGKLSDNKLINVIM